MHCKSDVKFLTLYDKRREIGKKNEKKNSEQATSFLQKYILISKCQCRSN